MTKNSAWGLVRQHASGELPLSPSCCTRALRATRVPGCTVSSSDRMALIFSSCTYPSSSKSGRVHRLGGSSTSIDVSKASSSSEKFQPNRDLREILFPASLKRVPYFPFFFRRWRTFCGFLKTFGRKARDSPGETRTTRREEASGQGKENRMPKNKGKPLAETSSFCDPKVLCEP